nr:MAG TPA: hypothetical protein [Caudoviricetes sp.]
MSYTDIATARATAETYAGKMSRIAAELLDVLRDVLGPERRLSKPRADYAGYGDHAVTVRDGEDGRVEVTAHLNDLGLVCRYTAGLTRKGSDGLLRTVVGPLSMDCSEAPEEHPTLTYVLPLVVRLEFGAERMQAAQRALEAAGRPVEECGPNIILRDPCAWGTRTVATVEIDPDNGALRVHGRDADEVCRVLRKANVF